MADEELIDAFEKAMLTGYSMHGRGLTHNLARAGLDSGLVVPATELAGARSDHEFTWAQLNKQTAKLDQMRRAVLDIAEEIDAPTDGYDEVAARLRALVAGGDRG